MTASRYPGRTSGIFTLNDQVSQVIMVRPCVSSRYADSVILQRTVDRSRRIGRLREHQEMDRPVIVVTAVH